MRNTLIVFLLLALVAPSWSDQDVCWHFDSLTQRLSWEMDSLEQVPGSGEATFSVQARKIERERLREALRLEGWQLLSNTQARKGTATIRLGQAAGKLTARIVLDGKVETSTTLSPSLVLPTRNQVWFVE